MSTITISFQCAPEARYDEERNTFVFDWQPCGEAREYEIPENGIVEVEQPDMPPGTVMLQPIYQGEPNYLYQPPVSDWTPRRVTIVMLPKKVADES